MNNEQFRRLLVTNNNSTQDGNTITPKPGATPMLGSRQKSSIPMTPRSFIGKSGVDFARQLAERNAGPAKSKNFRSAAPKGSRLATGYHSRRVSKELRSAVNTAGILRGGHARRTPRIGRSWFWDMQSLIGRRQFGFTRIF